MCAVAAREQTRRHSLAATVKSPRYKADGTAEDPGGNGTRVLASDDGDEAPDLSPARAARRASSVTAQTETPARPCCCEIAAGSFVLKKNQRLAELVEGSGAVTLLARIARGT